jgi:acetyltransferase
MIHTSLDLLSESPSHPLDPMFHPHAVAVVGATDRLHSVGRTVLENLLQGRFAGRVYAVNPGRGTVLEQKAYPGIGSVPETVDLAVIVTPAATVPGIMRECAQAGVRAAVILSAGFRELGPSGAKLESQIDEAIQGTPMRVIGPNCLGLMTPSIGLNATFAQQPALPGKMAFLSQSGALCTSILDWSLREMVGFSAFVSTGSMLDVGWGDLIYYFGDDPNTQSILIYMESIGDPRAFLSAAREIALTKPIVVIKPGRTEAAAKAAVSHTGALTGADDVLDAAFRRCGVLRVQTIGELFDMAEVLSKQMRPRGPRLLIVTNAGGPGVLATDALVGGGGELTQLSPATAAALDRILPPHWSHANPVDILGDADPNRYAAALDILSREENADGMLAVMSPQGMTDPTEVAARVSEFKAGYPKPLLASWMGGSSVEHGLILLNRSGVSTFSFPDSAAQAFNYMWQYSRNLLSLYETPAATLEETDSAQAPVAEMLAAVRRKGRSLLTELESKRILALYGFSTLPIQHAETPDQAVQAAEGMGFPVVLKVHSETITHKARVGGVRLHLNTTAEVKAAFEDIREAVGRNAGPEHFLGVTVQPMVQTDGYEIIAGSTIDAQFGPVLLFGTGGRFAERIADHALGLPPLTTTLARRMMERTRALGVVESTYGRPTADLLAQAMVRLSLLVVDQPWIREIDINPLLVSVSGLVALDARIVLHAPDTREEELPRPAIRPYPKQYSFPWRLKDGSEVILRPILPEDEPRMVEFHKALSEQTVYLRYFQASSLRHRTSHERLMRLCFIDYDREMAIVALRTAEDGSRQIIGVGRLSKLHGKNEAEVALIVTDQFQQQGVGRQLLSVLVNVARDEGLKRILAFMLPENTGMQAVARHVGFQIETPSGDPDTVVATLQIV